MISCLHKKITTEKELLVFSFMCVALFTIAAHGFWFFNLDLSHDYLNEMYALGVMGWKITIGRFLAPFINIAIGQFIVLPWLSGIIMIICLGLVVILISKMFALDRRWQIALLAGLLSTSLALTALLASFMGDLAANMIALLLATLAAFEWNVLAKDFSVKAFLLCVLLSFLSLGCYQGYLTVTIVLIVIKSIESLISKETALRVFWRGLLGAMIIIFSMASYFGVANLVGALTGYGLASNTTNSLSNVWLLNESLFRRGFDTYLYTLWGLFAPTLSAVPARTNLISFSKTTWQVYLISLLNVSLFIIMIVSLLKLLRRNKLSKSSIFMIVALFLFLPFAANIMHFLSGSSHILMHYAFTLFYLLFIVILAHISKEPADCHLLKKYDGYLVALVGVIVLINTSFSNLLYTKKDLEKQSTLATMTRVLSAIEQQDDYVSGETKLCFIGNLEVQRGLNDVQEVSMLFGAEYKSAVTYQATYNAYLNNLLQYKAITCSPDESKKIESSEEFSRMEAFPADSAIQKIDDILVIKMGD